MPDWLWPALAFVMIIEGLLPFVAPRVWRDTFVKLTALSDGQLRFIGLVAILVGVLTFVVLGDA